jgi:hypothetical protein
LPAFNIRRLALQFAQGIARRGGLGRERRAWFFQSQLLGAIDLLHDRWIRSRGSLKPRGRFLRNHRDLRATREEKSGRNEQSKTKPTES